MRCGAIIRFLSTGSVARIHDGKRYHDGLIVLVCTANEDRASVVIHDLSIWVVPEEFTQNDGLLGRQ